MRRPSWKNVKADIISRISYDAGMGFQDETSAGIGQSRGESVYTYVVPCSSLATQTGLAYDGSILSQIKSNMLAKIQILNFYRLVWGWCSAGGILPVVLTAEETAAPSGHITNEGSKGQCAVPCCVLVSVGISNAFLTTDVFDSHQVYLEATPSLVKDTCITQRTKSWWCDKKSGRDHGFGDRRPRMKTGNDTFQKSSQATPCSCLY